MDQEETPLKQIRTYQGDIAEALKRQQESLVSIQRSERLHHGAPQEPETPEQKRRKQIFYLIFGSFVFFVLAGVGSWFTYNEFIRRTVSPITAAPANRFISSNTETRLDTASILKSELINSLRHATTNLGDNELGHIVLEKPSVTGPILLTSEEFLTKLESKAPGALVRALDPLFMFGAIGSKSTSTPTSIFLIIKLTSFDNAFAGMLEWEKDLGQDLGPLFATSATSSGPLAPNLFIDITDRNKDVRALMLNNVPVLLYSFFDNTFLIVTDRLETLRTIVDRLTREKLSR